MDKSVKDASRTKVFGHFDIFISSGSNDPKRPQVKMTPGQNNPSPNIKIFLENRVVGHFYINPVSYKCCNSQNYHFQRSKLLKSYKPTHLYIVTLGIYRATYKKGFHRTDRQIQEI